jgi:hypothetical protein
MQMPQMNWVEAQQQLREEGWCTVRLPNAQPVQDTVVALRDKLRSMLGDSQVELADYHRHFAGTEAQHSDNQDRLTQFFRERRFGWQILSANLELWRFLIGPDLDIQREPYLRVTRPGQAQDNIGLHRDTFYGGSPYEVSVWIPYVSVPAAGSLSILPGSHVMPESAFPTVSEPSPDVAKGSVKHKLGFLYAPKTIASSSIPRDRLKSIAISVGEVLVFTLSTLHGSEQNRSDVTRWSSDIRLKNALAPVDLSMRPTYYEPFTRSAVTEAATRYFKSNASEH